MSHYGDSHRETGDVVFIDIVVRYRPPPFFFSRGDKEMRHRAGYDHVFARNPGQAKLGKREKRSGAGRSTDTNKMAQERRLEVAK